MIYRKRQRPRRAADAICVSGRQRHPAAVSGLPLSPATRHGGNPFVETDNDSARRERRHVLIFQHDDDSPAGFFADWAQERDFHVDTMRVDALQKWPSLDETAIVVSLAAGASSRGTERWIHDEISFLRTAHAKDVAVLGICFGAQALATALGGRVKSRRKMAAEWSRVDVEDEDLMTAGPWLRWHEEEFHLPPNARLLARAGGTPLAFVAGKSVGLQFHPEVDAWMAKEWISNSADKLLRHLIDQPVLAHQIVVGARGARRRAWDLFDRLSCLWNL
jgi:GMP synthase-like glutamine amidotransferase